MNGIRKTGSLLTTPPESFVNAPPTPPPSEFKPSARVLSVVALLRRRRDGRAVPEQPWCVFRLQPGEYEQIEQLLRADEALWGYVNDKARYDYWARSGRFVLRMPTRLHDTLIMRVADEIDRQLRVIADGTDPAAEFAWAVDKTGSSRLTFDADDEEDGSTVPNKHDPDASFHHSDAQYPGVVIEVSYSQKRKDLPQLAEEYILGSNGNIRVVVGLDIEYRGTKKATMSVWRPQYMMNHDGEEEMASAQVVTDQMFRDEEGNMVSEGNLELQLEDFAPNAVLQRYGELRERIVISSATLCQFLSDCEAKARRIEQREGLSDTLKPGARKRRREKTPPEQLNSDDESRFDQEERRAAKRMERDDSSYKTSSMSEPDIT